MDNNYNNQNMNNQNFNNQNINNGYYNNMNPVPPQQTNGLAVGGMITGIMSIFFSAVPIIGFIVGIVGFILSIVAIGQINERNEAGHGMAIAGVVCGIVGFIGAIFWTIIYLAAIFGV